MPPCHLIRPKTNLMVAFLLIDIIGMSVHHSHFSACHSLRSVIKTKASPYGTGPIFDRLKNLIGHFVHTEPFNVFALFTRNRRTRSILFFFVRGFTICPCAERYYSKSKLASPSLVTTHPCNRVFAIRNFRRLWRSHLAGQSFSTTFRRLWCSHCAG